MNEIKAELNKWRSIPCSGIGRFNIVKILALLNLIYIRSSMQSQSKSQQVILWISTKKSLYGEEKDPEKPTQY